MDNPDQREYPPSHPFFGRTLIQVHDHDILLGRGVNIAQHPGNERFRALVSARKDDSYCTSFLLSEKRALAEEIVAHIKSLDPPGRFLKRLGRMQGSKGLAGPWEEVPHRECIKKTCQALRDCNRQDRTGYASAVAAPTDVAVSIEERAKSGLSLKQHAAAVAAEAARLKQNRNASNMYHAYEDSKHHAELAHVVSLDNELSQALDANPVGEFSLRDDNVSPTVGLAAQWLKKQRREEPHSGTNGFCMPDLGDSHVSTQSTPAPLAAPIPVTATPGPHSHQESSSVSREGYLSAEHLLPSHDTDSPQFHLSGQYHTDSMAPAPYSPVVLHHHDQDVYPSTDLDHHRFAFHTNDHDHDDHNGDYLLHTAAAVAASSLGHGSGHHRNNSLTLDDDEIPHDTLRISDF